MDDMGEMVDLDGVVDMNWNGVAVMDGCGRFGWVFRDVAYIVAYYSLYQLY